MQPLFTSPNSETEAGDTEACDKSERGSRQLQSQAQSQAQGVRLPLQSVVAGLPAALKGRARQVDLGTAEISIPIDKVLTQLSLGSVKITFGELRRAAPTLFSSEDDQDRTLVALPLAQILPQLNPALLFRRQSQKVVEVPEEIRSPFGETGGQALIFSVGPGETPAATPERAVTPVPSSAAPTLSLPAVAADPTPAAAPLPTVPNVPISVSPKPVSSSANSPEVTSMSTPQAVPPAVEPVPDKTPSGAGLATVKLPLAAVSQSWPESLRLEIAQLQLADLALALPVEVLKASLQRGKAFYTWKTLRGWFSPVLAPYVSVHDAASLELPLSVVAPLFISRQRDLAQSKQKVAIDETIPNLFFGFPQAEAAAPAGKPPGTASCAVARPVDTNYYSLGDGCEASAPAPNAVKPAGPSGTAFVTKCATPNEIVSRAASLSGVSGALVALPDGLMVASKLSSDLNGDTLAAFLPQIFGKVNQCTKELRMGELNNLNFTVGNVPWKIFRVNAIFFAAFGRSGQPLPTAELAALASELDHKKQ